MGHGGWLIGRFVAFRPKGHEFESHSSRHVGTLSKFLAHNALHYNRICATEACKCTSELGMHKEEGRYQRSVVMYCIDLKFSLIFYGKLNLNFTGVCFKIQKLALWSI